MNDIQEHVREAISAAYHCGRHEANRDNHSGPGDDWWETYDAFRESEAGRALGHRFRALELVYDRLGFLI